MACIKKKMHTGWVVFSKKKKRCCCCIKNHDHVDSPEWLLAAAGVVVLARSNSIDSTAQ